MVTTCKSVGCDKPIKAKGLCSRHLSRLYRTESINRRPSHYAPRWPCECIYVIGGNDELPVRIGRSANVLQYFRRARAKTARPLFLRGAFFCRPRDAFVLEKKIEDVLVEMGFRTGKGWYDLEAKDALQVVRKCARLLPVEIFSPEAFHRFASDAYVYASHVYAAAQTWAMPDGKHLGDEWFVVQEEVERVMSEIVDPS